MLEPIEGMQPGTLGWRTKGSMRPEDYTEVFVPAVRATLDAGEELRMLFAVGDDFGETPRAMWEDMKAGMNLGLAHWKSWTRVAFVTDVEWLARAFKAFAWMIPGEAKLFSEAELADAQAWVAG
jgi:hypothetical protein